MAEIKEILSTAQTKMQKTIEVLRVDLASVRAGRASVSLLDKVMVEYYGTPTPVNQVASVTVPEPRMIVIQPMQAAIAAISSPTAAADSILPSIMGVISISAAAYAAPNTASAMHIGTTGLYAAHAVCTMYHVFCHILYLGLVFFLSVASITDAAPLPFHLDCMIA